MKRLFFFVYICCACFMVQAQEATDRTRYLQVNDTVTIRKDNTYFTVDEKGTTIIAHNEPNDNALWRIVWCLYKKESAGIKANTNSNM